MKMGRPKGKQSPQIAVPGLKAWRERMFMTQQHVADRAGVHIMSVSRWERGERTAPTNKIEKLLTATVGHVPDNMWLDITGQERAK